MSHFRNSPTVRRLARSLAPPHHHAHYPSPVTSNLTNNNNPNNRVFDSSDPRLWSENENILLVDDAKQQESSPESALYPVSNQLYTSTESDQNTLFAFYNKLNVNPFLFALAAKPAKKVWDGIVSDVLELQQRQDAPKFKVLYEMIQIQIFDANICPPTSLPTAVITNIAQSYAAIFNSKNESFSTQQFATKLETEKLNCLRIQFDRDDAFFKSPDSKNWPEHLLYDLNDYINIQKEGVFNSDTIFYVTTYLPDYVWHACLIWNYGMDALHVAEKDDPLQLAIRHRTAQDFIRTAGLQDVPKIGMILRKAPPPNKTWDEVQQSKIKKMWTNSWELVVGVKHEADLGPVLDKIAAMHGKQGMGLKSEVIKVVPFKYKFTKTESLEKYILNYCYVCKKHVQPIARHVCNLEAAQALRTQKDLLYIEPLLRQKQVSEAEIAITRINFKSESCNICTGLNPNCFHKDKDCNFDDAAFNTEIKNGRNWCNQCEKWTNHKSGEFEKCADFVYFHNARVGRMLHAKVVMFERENAAFIKVCAEELEVEAVAQAQDKSHTVANAPTAQQIANRQTDAIMKSLENDFSALSIKKHKQHQKQQQKQHPKQAKSGALAAQQPPQSLPPQIMDRIRTRKAKLRENQKQRYARLKAKYLEEKHAILGMDGRRFRPKLAFMEPTDSLASVLNNELVAAHESESKKETLDEIPTPGNAQKDTFVSRFHILNNIKPVPYGTHKLNQKIPPYLQGLRSKDLKSLPKYKYGFMTNLNDTGNKIDANGAITTTAGLVSDEDMEDIDIAHGQTA